jgi:hypothetical protein
MRKYYESPKRSRVIIHICGIVAAALLTVGSLVAICFLISHAEEQRAKDEVATQTAIQNYRDNSNICKFMKFVDENPARFDIDYSLDPDSDRFLINWGATSFIVKDKEKNISYRIEFSHGLHTIKMYRNGTEIAYGEHYRAHLQLIKHFTEICKRNSQYYRDIEANKMLQDINAPVTLITSRVSEDTIEINVQQSNQDKKNIELNAN